MNAVEIEQSISELAQAPYDRAEFPYLFLEAFGEKPPTLKRLRTGNSNKSDIAGGVLQRNNIHIATCDEGEVGTTLRALKDSPETTKAKAKLILATDGIEFQAEYMVSGETVACDYSDFANHFGFFLLLAGISTVPEIRDNPIDIKATSRLNRLYVELLRHNPDWGAAERRHDMNQFMARLIFCFFAEDTDIFNGEEQFTKTIEQMSESDASNLDYVIGELFRAMNTPRDDRADANLPNWTNEFPYVNGGLFDGVRDVPKFTKIARSYLIHAGNLDWKAINPDIFGSMIQAVADDEERGALGMHYTSVPNILKVLDPLFLDELRAQLEEAGKNGRKLLNLRKRMSRIRIFDPACGSGNFLVIAYKEMRKIEAEINSRRGESDHRSDIPLTNFRGIEIKDFAAEIARLALIIAEYQCDVLYRGQKDALAEFLPLNRENWIVCGNALRLDWFSVCPPTGSSIKYLAEDFFHTPLDQTEIDFANEGGETFICGNPPYSGKSKQLQEQKEDLKAVFGHRTKTWKSLDYVAGWFMKAVDYGNHTPTAAAFVSTNSICQGEQVPILWRLIIDSGHEIIFAHTSFKWANLASHNAGVIVAIVGVSKSFAGDKRLYSENKDKEVQVNIVSNINGYLAPSKNVLIKKVDQPISNLVQMSIGSKPVDYGCLILTAQERSDLAIEDADIENRFVKPFLGSKEFIDGKSRFCLWVNEADYKAENFPSTIKKRFEVVKNKRLESEKAQTRERAISPFSFAEIRHQESKNTIVVPSVSSEGRDYLPVGLVAGGTIISNLNFALYDAPIWNMALIASRLHWVWIATVCGKLGTGFRYSNTLGWNTFPVPNLTKKDKAELTHCAENILLAREAHFPATIADLYTSDKMPDNLRVAHDRNDETLERIYIGRRFKNDTERIETLFDFYVKMTSPSASGKAKEQANET